MENSPNSFIERSGLHFEEKNPGFAGHELVDVDAIDDWYHQYEQTLAEIVEKYSGKQNLEDFDRSQFSYCVPEITEDGFCSYPDKLAKEPYNLADTIGGETLENARLLAILNDFVEFGYKELHTDWLGYYRRFELSPNPALVKLAYRGIPSRAEFPVTPTFAEKSNNSKVAIDGKTVIINNLEVHLKKGGAFYICDEAVRSEACLPIFNKDMSQIIGVIDAESTKTYAYKAPELSKLVALSLCLTGLLDQ